MAVGGGLVDFDQYSNVKPMLKAFPSWVEGQDRDRIASYSLYDQIYHNIPEAFKVYERGSDEDPIYIPAAKQIIETMHRFLAPNLKIIPDPMFGTDAEKLLAQQVITAFTRRERFYSRFNTAKREGLRRGDWLFHMYANPELPEGSRISIFALDPASYFPIFNEENVDQIIGCHLAEYLLDESGKPYIRRLTYRKETGTGGPSPITVEDALFEVDGWGGPDAKTAQVIRKQERLPDLITALPVYHIQNTQETGTPWGSSELRGLERVLAAINQSISDEELTLVLEGLGVYATDAGTPINEDTGDPEPWNIGPARVVELPDGKKMWRVNGATSVTPYQDHLGYLHDQLDLASATPSVAKGNVDVDVAESGIALMLKMSPLTSRAEEKELIVTDVLNNLLYDLKTWFQVYEGVNIGEALWIPAYGDRIPVNRKQRFDELVQMHGQKLISGIYFRAEVRKLGYEMPDETVMVAQILQEQQDTARVEADAMGLRMDAEIDSQQAPEGEPGTAVTPPGQQTLEV